MKKKIILIVVLVAGVLCSERVRFYLGGALIELGFLAQATVDDDLEKLSGDGVFQRLLDLNA